MGISRDLIELATQNGGYLSREQLLANSVSASRVDRMVNEGDLLPLKEGIYQVIPSSDHSDLLRGALLALPQGVASHQSAAHLLKLPSPPRLEPTVTVPSHTTHRFPGVTVRRAGDLSPTHLVSVNGIPCTNSPRTLFDLAGVVSYRVFERVAESAMVAKLLSLDQLEAMRGEIGRRGKGGTKAVSTFVEARLFAPEASVLERKGRRILLSMPPPHPVSEYRVPWAPGRRFDDAYPDHRLAVEWDSRSWHQRRSEMRNDRKRDRDAVRHGWVVVRFTWEDVTSDPQTVSESVSAILSRRRSLRTEGS